MTSSMNINRILSLWVALCFLVCIYGKGTSLSKKTPPYMGDSVTSMVEFLAEDGISTGNYVFQYSKSENVGSFQRNGNYEDAGPNTVSIYIRNFTSGYTTAIVLNQFGSCNISQNIMPTYNVDITANLQRLQENAIYIGSQQIGAYMCDGWQFPWFASSDNETLITWITTDVNGNPRPVRTDFPSTDEDSHAYFTYFLAGPIDPRVFQIIDQYEPCTMSNEKIDFGNPFLAHSKKHKSTH